MWKQTLRELVALLKRNHCGRMRHIAMFSMCTAILVNISGCSSPANSSSFSKSAGPTGTFSTALNSTSVFIGASIIYYWPLPLNNRGIAGQTTSQVLARFKSQVVGHGYVRVIILCGTNDVLQNTPNVVAEVTANLKTMSQIASDAGLEVVLSELPPAVSGGVDLSAKISAINSSIAQLAADQGYLLVDYFTPLYGHPEYFVDGIHPNAAGYALMERALSAVVVQ